MDRLTESDRFNATKSMLTRGRPRVALLAAYFSGVVMPMLAVRSKLASINSGVSETFGTREAYSQANFGATSDKVKRESASRLGRSVRSIDFSVLLETTDERGRDLSEGDECGDGERTHGARRMGSVATQVHR